MPSRANAGDGNGFASNRDDKSASVGLSDELEVLLRLGAATLRCSHFISCRLGS